MPTTSLPRSPRPQDGEEGGDRLADGMGTVAPAGNRVGSQQTAECSKVGKDQISIGQSATSLDESKSQQKLRFLRRDIIYNSINNYDIFRDRSNK